MPERFARFPGESPLRAFLRRLRPLVLLISLIGAIAGLTYVGLDWVLGSSNGCSSLHIDLQLRGQSDCAAVALEEFRGSLRRDAGFALGYGVLLTILSRLIRPAVHLASKLRLLSAAGSFSFATAAAFDLIENILLWFGTSVNGAEFVVQSRSLAVIIAMAAWTKWILVVAGALNLVWLIAGVVSERPFPHVKDGWWDRAKGWFARNGYRFWRGGQLPTRGRSHSPARSPAVIEEVPNFALCCSGGGIRAAGFALGAMWEMERRGVMDQVGVIAAVSGGNYAATAWCVERASPRTPPSSSLSKTTSAVIEQLAARRSRDRRRNQSTNQQSEQSLDPLERAEATIAAGHSELSVLLEDRTIRASAPYQSESGAIADQEENELIRPERSRAFNGAHRYLSHGPGGLSRSVMYALAAIVANIGQILAVLLVVGWGFAFAVRGTGMHSTLKEELAEGCPARPAGAPLPGDQDACEFLLEWFHWQPGLWLVIVGAIAIALSAIAGRPKRRKVVVSIGVLLVMSGLVALMFSLIWPWLIVNVDDLLSGRPSFVVSGLSLGAVAVAVARIIANPIRKRAARLGGVFLALLLFIFVGKVIRDVLIDGGWFGHLWVLWGALGVCAFAGFVVDTQMFSVRELYRSRLTRAFIAEHNRHDRWPPGHNEGITWAALRERLNRPELIVCCSASRVGLSPAGIPAESFTISQYHVRHHRALGSVEVETDRYVKLLRSLATRPLRSPAGWLSTSGAAFASSMGRASVGSSNALLAALNADLGIWLPMPSLLCKGEHPKDVALPDGVPPVRMGQLFNEIFGLYAPNDDLVFVTDGGHVENLGLGEALRDAVEKGLDSDYPRIIISLDASGDEVGSFETLRRALRDANMMLPGNEDENRLWFDTSELDASLLPATTCVYQIPFRLWPDRPLPPVVQLGNREVGYIYYVKLQPSMSQSQAVRRFAKLDPKFPTYSTANQLLDDQQFTFLLFAGRDAGRDLVSRLASDGIDVPQPRSDVVLTSSG